MKKLSILVVDDDNAHRTMLCTLLGGWGYAAAEAEDGEVALARCREQNFDLVLTDVRMPKKNGLEALKEIKGCNPFLPVLIMTAYSNIEAAVEAIKAGAYDYLTKPLDFDKLKITLRNIFAYTTLRRENSALRDSLSSSTCTSDIIGQSRPLQQLLEMVRTIAPAEVTVLICGESGTGKELVAKALHKGSPRAAGPYVAFNCAALAESLIESELFGHEKGAFTGADKRREGRFAAADKGTLFLDEIGEMPLRMQTKLLRVIQEREVQPLGGNHPVPVDVRLIAATNLDLLKEVEAGRFREDLYYRLNVVQLTLPALRERPDDIPMLAQHFLEVFARKNKKMVKGFTPGAMSALLRHHWPGNVRELENAMARAAVLLLGEQVSELELPPQILKSSAAGVQADTSAATLKDREKELILDTLRQLKGNKSETARRLGITRKTLHLKLQKYTHTE